MTWKKVMVTALVLAAFAGAWVQTADAASDEQLLERLKDKLALRGPIDEGKKDNRNGLRTGSVKDWKTYPGDIHFEYGRHGGNEVKWMGTITYHFSGRERVADYVGGAQRDTNDHQTSGKVTAEYEVGRSGKVSISNVRKHGGRGRVGDAVVKHVRSMHNEEL